MELGHGARARWGGLGGGGGGWGVGVYLGLGAGLDQELLRAPLGVGGPRCLGFFGSLAPPRMARAAAGLAQVCCAANQSLTLGRHRCWEVWSCRTGKHARCEKRQVVRVGCRYRLAAACLQYVARVVTQALGEDGLGVQLPIDQRARDVLPKTPKPRMNVVFYVNEYMV